MRSASFLFSLNFSILLGLVVGQDQQRIEVFSASATKCVGPASHNFTSSTNLTLVQNSTGISLNGMWGMRISPDLDYYYLDQSDHKICIDGHLETGTRLELTRYGDEFQRERRISFYGQYNLLEGVASFTGGQSYIDNLTYSSFLFTGPNEWRLYEGQNYSGRSICWAPSELTLSRGYGVTTQQVSNGVLVSIKYGCEIIPPSTAQTPTTPSQPTSTSSGAIAQTYRLLALLLVFCISNVN